MVEIASQIVICLVVASLIGFLIGFLVGRGTRSNTEYSNYCSTTSKIKGNIYNKPEIKSRPRPSGKDDLKQIEGIDSRLENLLNQLGVFHFDQVAKWNDKNCDWVEDYLEFEEKGAIKQQQWVEQAAKLTKSI